MLVPDYADAFKNTPSALNYNKCTLKARVLQQILCSTPSS